jgi:hypothetical protein
VKLTIHIYLDARLRICGAEPTDAYVFIEFYILLENISYSSRDAAWGYDSSDTGARVCRLPVAAPWVPSRVSSRRICGGKSDIEVGFRQVLLFPLPILIPPTAPHSFPTIIPRAGAQAHSGPAKQMDLPQLTNWFKETFESAFVKKHLASQHELNTLPAKRKTSFANKFKA